MFQRLEGNNELLVSSPARQQTSEMPPDYLRQIFQIILRKRRTFKAKSYCNIEILHNEKIIMSLRLGCQGQMFPKCWPMPGFFGGFAHNAMRAPKVINYYQKKCALIPQNRVFNQFIQYFHSQKWFTHFCQKWLGGQTNPGNASILGTFGPGSQTS